MQFEELWEIVREQNNALWCASEEPINLTVKSFKKALKLSYDQGYLEGVVQKNKDNKYQIDVIKDLLHL